MEWTTDQEQVLAWRGDWLRVVGGAGSGRTSVLVERWRRGACKGRPDRLLVLCRSRGAADRFGRAALAGGAWAAETLAFSTFFGAAFDLLHRHGDDRRLLRRGHQWNLVRRLLVADDARLWPSCRDFVGRAAFVDQVAASVLAVEASGMSDVAVQAVAGRWGQGDRWADLLAFRQRYRRATGALGVVDEAQLFTEASAILDDEQVRLVESARWDEILIDDAEVATAAMGRLVERLSPTSMVAVGERCGTSLGARWPRWGDVAGWAAVVSFERCHRPSPSAVAAICRHPSEEPGAVAAALTEAHRAGVDWREMAVLVPRSAARTQAVGRELARQGIPCRVTPSPPATEPVVRALLDFFAWAAGDEEAFARLLVSPAVALTPGQLRRLRCRGAYEGVAFDQHPSLRALAALREEVAPRLASDDPAALAHRVWVGLLGHLVPDPGAERSDALGERAWVALSAYLEALSERSAQYPAWRVADELALAEGPDLDSEPWAPTTPTGEEDVVTVDTIRSAAGRSWDTVVVCGCLEGELPCLPSATQFFDAAVLDRAARTGRVEALQQERRLFDLAVSRARSRLVLAAAPASGQVVSRFLAEAATQVTTSRIGARQPEPLASAIDTEGVVPVHPDRRLDLSASRLTTYDDCPLRYFYRYTLGVRGPGGVAASIGTVVHAALAAFLTPAPKPPSAGSASEAAPVLAASEGDHSWPALEALAASLWDEGWSQTIAPYQPVREQARRDVFSMLRQWWEAEAGLGIDGGWPDVVAVEHPFEIDVGGHRVCGSIDRIDRVPEGLAIIDYKTGSKVPRADEVAEDLQLATYHLAACRDLALAALGPPVSLRLWYLRSGVAVSQPIIEDHERRTEARIVAIAERILAEEFEPSVEAECEYCDFKRLCPLQVEGRQVSGE